MKNKKTVGLLMAAAMLASSALPVYAEEEAKSVDLTILYEEDESMINNYSLLAVNPDAPFVDADGKEVTDVALNTAGADALIN